MDVITKKERSPVGSGGWVEGYEETTFQTFRFKSIDGQKAVAMHTEKFTIREFRERLKAYPKEYKRSFCNMSNQQLTEYFNLSDHLI